MACPFFMPVSKLVDDSCFLHPLRLPLGGAWKGYCCAPGHEGAQPTHQELTDCNLGYATSCARLPKQRECDAVRFSVVRDLGSKLHVCFVSELDYRPRGHGQLEYDVAMGQWASPHENPRVQKMAECCVDFYLQRRNQSVQPELTASANL
jgi:hypothetical protein